MANIRTMKDAERHAAQAGVTLTASEREKIAALQNAERERLKVTQAKKERWTWEWFNGMYAGVLETILHLQDLLQAGARTLIVGFGITAILVIALVVEQQRLVEGVLLFEKSHEIAERAAWFLVLLNAALEFVIFYEDNRRGWQSDNRQVWSLKIAVNNLRYRFGIGDDWTERKHPPSFWARQMLRLITWVVLALALFGSMKEEMAAHANNYLAALGTILTQSTLLEMATWLSGFLFALAAVRGAQGTARYLAARTAEVTEELKAQRTNNNTDESAVDAVAIDYIMAKLAKQEAKERAKAERKTDAQVIDAEPVTAGNGHTSGGNGTPHRF